MPAKIAMTMPKRPIVSGKKCIPGVICVENMTLFMLFIIFVLLAYMFMQQNKTYSSNIVNPYTLNTAVMDGGLATRLLPGIISKDTFNDPYAPPLKSNAYYFPSDSRASMGGITQIQTNIGIPVAVAPVNVQTRGFSPEYIQIGILTRENGQEMILPLMGRRTMNGRDKYQYYTISNTGAINTKLPIKVRGRSCTSEYGCDEIMSGDTVYVEGYKETFQTTVYENSMLSYIPYL